MNSTLSPLHREDFKGRQYSSWLPPILYTLLAAAVAGIVSFAIFKPILVLPRITVGPGFMLSDAKGNLVTSETYRGRITLYSFSYLACEVEGCSQPLAAIAETYQVMDRLEGIATPLTLATISLDPTADTPDRLKEFVHQQPGGKLRWDYLTSDPERIRHIVGGGFELYFDEKIAGNGRQIVFQPRYVLVDGRGLIRAYYHDRTIDPEILRRDIRLLDEETRHSRGIGQLGYEAAHLFVCYP